jgi:peptide/nickel transport system substrate-binding protein
MAAAAAPRPLRLRSVHNKSSFCSAYRRGAGVSLAIVAVMSLVACEPRDVSQQPSPVLRIAFGIGPTARASGVTVLTDLLYNEPLIAHDSTGRPIPALATSWAWTDEGRRLDLRLKPDVKFHDGTPLTADLVVEFLGQHRTSPGGVVPLGFERVTDITAPDPSTVSIRLSTPDIFLLSELNELRIVHPSRPDIGTGPFRLIKRQPIVEAHRFSGYHGGSPASEVVQIVTYETQRRAWAALMRNEADAAQEISRESVEFMERSSHVETYASLQPFYIPLVFNQRHPVLRNPEVRRAIDQAIDRQAIVAKAMRGRGLAADGPIWPHHWAFAPGSRPASHDPAAAAALLDKAGLRLKAGVNGGPKARFSFRCLFWSEDQQYERIALLVQRQLFDIGIQVELEPVTLRTLAERASSGDFDAFLARANAGRSLMFMYRFWRSPRSAERALWLTGYTGADAALDRLRESTSSEQTRTALTALAQRFHADVPATFIAWTEVTRAVSEEISVGDAKVLDPFISIWRWQRRPSGASAP